MGLWDTTDRNGNHSTLNAATARSAVIQSLLNEKNHGAPQVTHIQPHDNHRR